MNYYESVVMDYLASDRAIFVNTECCIQLNQAEHPDSSGPHWYCDAVACDFKGQSIFLCEISYNARLDDLTKRLKSWHEDWSLVSLALKRDSFLPEQWPVRPWLFVPEQSLSLLLKRLEELHHATEPLKFTPRITPLEMVQPWRYRRWHRVGEAPKPPIIPEPMRS